MRQDIEKVVKTCNACQEYGIYKMSYHPLKSITPNSVFEVVCIDLAEVGKTSFQGNNFVLVICRLLLAFYCVEGYSEQRKSNCST